MPRVRRSEEVDQRVIHFYSVSAEYGQLSNFAPHLITLKGKHWLTSEHYFQAQKFVAAVDQEENPRCQLADGRRPRGPGTASGLVIAQEM